MKSTNFSERLETAFRNRSWIRYPFHFVVDFLTGNGRIFLACAALSAPLSFVAINTTAYNFFTMVTATFIIVFMLNYFYRPRVKCSGILPALSECGTKVSYQLIVANTGKKKLIR